MPSELVMRHRTPQFGHVFASDGYSAGYYSYLWSDVLTADAFEAFVEGKGPYDKSVAERLRKFIFSVGNTIDPAEGLSLLPRPRPARRGADAQARLPRHGDERQREARHQDRDEAQLGECGMRISDCGLEDSSALLNPQSEIRIPQSAKRRPLRVKTLGAAFCLSASLCLWAPPSRGLQRVVSDTPRQEHRLLGLRLSAEVASWLDEVERKLGKEIYAEFAELDEATAAADYTLGVSYLTEAGVGVVRVDESFRGRDVKLTEAVVGHELLHLRLRARGYPLFLFSPEVLTMRGRAQDVEQSNVNDLVSLIEHRIFAEEMRRTGFDKLIDLTNGLDAARRRRGVEDSQAETLNYARAALEWDDPRLLDELTRIHRANGWTRSLTDGRRLADIIRASNVTTPAGIAPVFLRCMAILYRAEFTVEADRRFALSKIYPQMLIHARRPQRRRR